jgi:hypothetical protein
MQLQLGFWALQSVMVDILSDNSIFTKLKNNTDIKDTVTVHFFWWGAGGGWGLCVSCSKTPDSNEVIQHAEKHKMGQVREKTLPLTAVQVFAFIRVNSLKTTDVQKVWIVLSSCLMSIQARLLLYSKRVKLLIIWTLCLVLVSADQRANVHSASLFTGTSRPLLVTYQPHLDLLHKNPSIF